MGRTGLPWLKEVKETYGMKTCIEVADEVHVVEALKAGIDMLWIGARTSSNPFQVRRLADCLAGTDIPVAVKNPMNPDLALWSGAIERLALAEIQNLMAIHRGFAVYGQVLRNAHQQIPIDFRNAHPEIPLINDPSHICGRRDILAEVAQMAMDLAFDGLMIEAHPDPDVAWTDTASSTPDALHALLDGLVIREEGADYDALDSLRRDQHGGRRHHRALRPSHGHQRQHRGGKQRGMTILQNKRWRDVLEKNLAKGRERHRRGLPGRRPAGPSTGHHHIQGHHEEVTPGSGSAEKPEVSVHAGTCCGGGGRPWCRACHKDLSTPGEEDGASPAEGSRGRIATRHVGHAQALRTPVRCCPSHWMRSACSGSNSDTAMGEPQELTQAPHLGRAVDVEVAQNQTSRGRRR